MARQVEDDVDIERRLALAMDADDPGPAFAGRVMAAIARERAASGAGDPAPSETRGGRSRVWYALLPLAATVAVTVAGARWQAARVEDARAADARIEDARIEDARARAAHAQLVQALRLTGAQLNVVHRAIERSQE